MSLKNQFLHSSNCSLWDQVSSFLTFFEIQKQWLQKKEISRAAKLCLDNSEELLKRYILSVKLFSVLEVSLRGFGAKVNSWWCGDFIDNHCQLLFSYFSFTTIFSGSSTSHKVNKLQERTEYQFRIQASNDAGAGPFSDVVSFMTTSQPPNVVKGGCALYSWSNWHFSP